MFCNEHVLVCTLVEASFDFQDRLGLDEVQTAKERKHPPWNTGLCSCEAAAF